MTKWAFITFLFICLFCRLGFWQLHRAQEKIILAQQLSERSHAAPKLFNKLDIKNDLRFYRTIISGEFDNQHTLLLDNKILNDQIGYEVYTPFILHTSHQVILVDRGFIPANAHRDKLPTISPIKGPIVLTGTLNKAPTYVAWGALYEPPLRFPLRVEYIDLSLLSQLVNTQLVPYVLQTTTVSWPPSTLTPEKHRAYAVQWFAFALTLLILFAVLNTRRRS
jgi:surfeit locus 1 family protein